MTANEEPVVSAEHDVEPGLGRRLGTVTEAVEALGLLDSAAVWDAVAAGRLHAERPTEDDRWTIYEKRSPRP